MNRGHTTHRRIAAAVEELGLPVPFDPAALAARLERGRGHPVHAVPFPLASDLFGAWIRTAPADYLYYEQQTSPFHQAHIALRLAVCMLLGQQHGTRLGPGALPAMGPELAELILAPGSPNPLTRQDTETFAFLALERVPGHADPFRTRRWLRQLRPLHAALRSAVPEAENMLGDGRPAARLRLYQRVIEIRSAQLALRPYHDPHVPIAADAAGREAGLDGDELAATVEAAVIAAALRAHTTKAARGPRAPDMSWAHRPDPDLPSEAVWLARVSHAFAGSPLIRELAHPQLPANHPK